MLDDVEAITLFSRLDDDSTGDIFLFFAQLLPKVLAWILASI